MTFKKVNEYVPSYLFSSLRDNNWKNLKNIFTYGMTSNYMCLNGTTYSCAMIIPLAQMPRILKKNKLLQPYANEIESLHKRMTKNVQTNNIRYTLNVQKKKNEKQLVQGLCENALKANQHIPNPN